MHTIPTRSSRLPQIAAAMFPLIAFAASAQADIYQWEYINPAGPSQGKQQSTTLAPDGAGVDAIPGADLSNRNLTMSYLIGADLSLANLSNANFFLAALSDADFAGAEIRGANFKKYDPPGGCCFGGFPIGTGITAAQLYSTASYQSGDLSGINFGLNEFAGGNFAGQNLTDADFSYAELTNADLRHANLTNASFGRANLTGASFREANLTNANFTGFSCGLYECVEVGATLTGADLTGAEVRGASFENSTSSGFTALQLYSTASYQAHDLSGIGLNDNNLTGANFAGQNLTNAEFIGATLTDAEFSNSVLRGVNFGRVLSYSIPSPFPFLRGSGITLSQLYSSASYQAHDLSGIGLSFNNLAGAGFASQNLANANFSSANLTDADFTNAEVQGATFDFDPHRVFFLGTGITLAQLYSTASYKAHELSGIRLGGHDHTGGNFADQNLSNAHFGYAKLTDADFREANLANANFRSATLTGANFTDAEIMAADLSDTAITLDQLYSTASYEAQDLSGIGLIRNDLSGGNFARQNLNRASFSYAQLTDADFTGAVLTDADFTGAEIRGANFAQLLIAYGPLRFRVGSGITLSQLYSTSSYQTRDLSGVDFAYNDLAGGNFAGQNLANARFYEARLTDADFTGAEVRHANFSVFNYLSGITSAQLYSTASYQTHDLTGIILSSKALSGWNFAYQNLTNANFNHASLGGTDFTGATIRGAQFGRGFGSPGGITLAQLYSTASYLAGDLSGINFEGNSLGGGNFAGQNLTNADFWYAELTDADFTAADARGAFPLAYSNLVDATVTNLIDYSGNIHGLDLPTDALLVIRDYDGDARRSSGPIPITVDQHLMMATGGTLRMVFEADAWDSTISFAPGIPVTLDGTLELTFADDVNLASQVGRTFDVFDWTGVHPTGVFAISSPYAWDLSNLYTTGEVSLVSVPEPATVFLAAIGLGVVMRANRSVMRGKPLMAMRGIHAPSSRIRPGIYAGSINDNTPPLSETGLRRRRSPVSLRGPNRAQEPGMNAGPNTACGGNDRKRSWNRASNAADARNASLTRLGETNDIF